MLGYSTIFINIPLAVRRTKSKAFDIGNQQLISSVSMSAILQRNVSHITR